MKIMFIDSNRNALDYEVGDIFEGYVDCSERSISDISDLNIVIDGGSIQAHNKHNGRHEMGWSLVCQTVFLIVDQETNQILYTSKKYDRRHRGAEFENDLREAIASGFNITTPSKFELSSEVEFMDI